MTITEFSNEFDTLVNVYSSTEFGRVNKLLFDEYEKSVFLTKAQEEIIIGLYNGNNVLGDSFEATEEIKRYLSSNIKTIELSPETEKSIGVSKNSYFFKLPEDVMFIVYESVVFSNSAISCDKDVMVSSVTLDDYLKTTRNPFKKPNNKRVLRLDIAGNIVELVSDNTISKYLLRYVGTPSPIILIDLPDGLSVNNINKKTDCKVNSSLHRSILDKAVQMAISSKIANK